MNKLCALLCGAAIIAGIAAGGADIYAPSVGYAEKRTVAQYAQKYEPIVISAANASVVEVTVIDPVTNLPQTYPVQAPGGIGALDVEGAGAEFFVDVPADGIYNIRLMSGNAIAGLNYVQTYIDGKQGASLYLEKNTEPTNWGIGGYCHNNFVYLTKGNHTIKLLRYTGGMYWLSLKVEFITETGGYFDFTQEHIAGDAESKQNKLGASGNALSGFAAGDKVTFCLDAEYAGDYSLAFIYGSSEKIPAKISVNGGNAKDFALSAMTNTGVKTGGMHCGDAGVTFSLEAGENYITISMPKQASDLLLDGAAYWVSAYADSDGDGLNDYLEGVLGTDPYEKDTGNTGVTDGDKDYDVDGLSNLAEVELGTDPTAADTDGDGLSDGDEVNQYKTDPLNPDTDGDGLSDGDEVNQYKTDPLNPDTDGDGLSDGDEISADCDPLKMDTDGDGLFDYQEVKLFGTDPLKADSDEDGISDYDEIYVYYTNPNTPDSDGDGLRDIEEIQKHKTDPLHARSQAFGKDDKQYLVLKTVFIAGGCLIGAGLITAGVLLFVCAKKKKGRTSDEKNSD